MLLSDGFFSGSRIARAAPLPTRPQCGSCSLHKRCENPKAPVTGEGRRNVLIVMENPEDAKGRDLLRRVLAAMGFDLGEDAWLTSSVICEPPRGRKPTAEEALACRPNLVKAIERLQPHTIIPLGATAVRSVLAEVWRKDVGAMGRWTGWDIPCQDLNAWVCPTWPPGYVRHEDDVVLNRQFRDHLAAAVAHTGRPWPTGPPKWGETVRRVTKPSKAATWLRKAATATQGALAWDYETNCLKPDGDDARIISCAVAWGRREPERCIAFPWHGEAVEAMGALLRSPVPKIAANIKFEDRWTRKAFGHRVRGWAWDTVLAAHVLDNRPGVSSVKFQALVRLGVTPWNDRVEQFLKTKGDVQFNRVLEEIDTMDLLRYNGLDALHEFRVACDQVRELDYPWPWKENR